MSVGLGGNPSRALDEAVRNSARSGVFYSLAARQQRHCDRCRDRQIQPGDLLEQLRQLRRHLGARCQDPLNEDGRRNDQDGWRLHGRSARRGGAALYLSKNTSASSSTVEAELKRAATRPGTRSKDGRAVLLENVGGF